MSRLRWSWPQALGSYPTMHVTPLTKTTLKSTVFLQTWNLKLLYYSRHEHKDIEEYADRVSDENAFLKQCDIVTINVPLTDKTRGERVDLWLRSQVDRIAGAWGPLPRSKL